MDPREKPDLLDVRNAAQIYDGDQLRNINSYEYLRKIVEAYKACLPKPPEQLEFTREELDKIQPLAGLVDFFDREDHQQYDPSYPYGDLYTKFVLELEKNIEKLKEYRNAPEGDQAIGSERQALREKIEEKLSLEEARFENNKETLKSTKLNPSIKKILLDAKKLYEKNIKTYKAQLEQSARKVLASIIDTCIDTVYANPNQGLERAANMIEDVLKRGTHQTSSKIEDSVRARMKGNAVKGFEKFKNDLKYLFRYRLNKTTPQHKGSGPDRFMDMMSNTFKPQTTTSMPSIRTYTYNRDSNGKYPIEYRFGTQGQYDSKQARVSPLFESWLEIQARKNPPEQHDQPKITHVYFNNLARDRTDFEGKREAALTEELHKLEGRHRNLAVITLPADKGLFDKKLLEIHERDITKENAFNRMLNIAIGVSEETVQDFHISPEIKKLLYGAKEDGWDKEKENNVIRGLLTNSFAKLGVKDLKHISPAEMQAVYFHFIKYELTNFIIEKLQPVSFNMSCKDAIDRGGVSSAYFNLMKSIDAGEPLNKDEFHRALHAAPTLVKGRGMNHHTRLIWNAVDKYINQFKKDHVAKPEELEKIKWLEEWRDDHAPKNSKLQWTQKIDAYRCDRAKDDRSYKRIVLGSELGIDRETKLLAAAKLKRLVNMPESDVAFTNAEAKALQQGKLGVLFKQLVKAKVVSKDQIKIKEPFVSIGKSLGDEAIPTRRRGKSF